MIYKATQEVATALNGLRFNFYYNIYDDDTYSQVICTIDGKYLTYQIHFLSQNDNDLQIGAVLAKFPEDKQETIILFANQCNAKYRHLRFVVNCYDNSLQVEYDCMLCSNPGKDAVEILLLITTIVESISSDLMHQIWS